MPPSQVFAAARAHPNDRATRCPPPRHHPAAPPAVRGTSTKTRPTASRSSYPSPYRVGMSSLGYQVIHRELNERPDTVAESAPSRPTTRRRAPRPRARPHVRVGDAPCRPPRRRRLRRLRERAPLVDRHASLLAGIPPCARSASPAATPSCCRWAGRHLPNPVPLMAFADAVIVGRPRDRAPRARRCSRRPRGAAPGARGRPARGCCRAHGRGAAAGGRADHEAKVPRTRRS